MQSRKLQTGKLNLTSVVCKLLESLLRDHMVDFLERRIKGYTARVSVRTIVFNKLVRIYGNNIKVGRWWVIGGCRLICLDFQKVLDKVPRQRP